MSKTSHFLAKTAQVDAAAIQPLPGSRKVYIEGSRPDIRVPFREISLSPTKTTGIDEENPPLLVYDTSGPYTDPTASNDLRHGLPPNGIHLTKKPIHLRIRFPAMGFLPI